MAEDQELQDTEDDRRIDGDRLILIPRWVLDDVIGILGLSEVATIDRKAATKVAQEIGRRIALDAHPANGG